MHRFMTEPNCINDGLIRLKDDDLKHLRQVLRLEAGDVIGVFDGTGIEYVARLIAVDKNEAVASVISSSKAQTEPETRVTLFQSLPKAEKMELIVQKTVELGVHRIVPVITERTVVKPDEKGSIKKLERWSRIAKEAVKQCGRSLVPQITKPIFFNNAISQCSDFDLAIMLYEQKEKKCLKELLKCYTINKIRDIALFIGPEGGFSSNEVELSKDQGCEIAWLGKRILRTETAAISVLSIIMYEMGEYQ